MATPITDAKIEKKVYDPLCNVGPQLQLFRKSQPIFKRMTDVTSGSMLGGNNTLPLPASASGNNNAQATIASALFSNALSTLRTSTATLQAFNPLPGISTTKQFLSQLRKETPKLLDVRAYGRPATGEEAIKRIRANVRFFRATYSIVSFCIAAVLVMSNPTVFVASVVLCAMWALFLSEPADAVLRLGNSVELKRNEKLVILVSSTVIVVFFSGLIASILYVVFCVGVVVGLHGAMREPIVLDALEELEQEGEQIVKEDVV